MFKYPLGKVTEQSLSVGKRDDNLIELSVVEIKHDTEGEKAKNRLFISSFYLGPVFICSLHTILVLPNLERL